MTEPQTANQTQIEGWNEGVGKTWVRFQAELDRQLEPIGAGALRAAALQLGQTVLDVGCGAGATTVEVASAVGRDGVVIGVDPSQPLLAVARARPVPYEAGQITFLAADAQTFGFEPQGFDAVVSRFGVMFFDDPGAAFANLRAGTKPGGRLAFCCWRGMEENPWMTLPLTAAASLVSAPAPSAPDAPGPFAFADPSRVRAVLTAGGWRDIALETFDTRIGGGDLDESARLMTRVGPLGAALREAQADKALIAQAEAAVRAAIEPYATPGGVLIPSATWIVTASA
jgi:SAM-dependent methyltransferase